MEINTHSNLNEALYNNILAALSFIIIWSALVYYFYSLNWTGIIVALISASLSFAVWIKFTFNTLETNWLKLWRYSSLFRYKDCSYWQTRSILIYLLLIIVLIGLAWQGRSIRPLISPWETISPIFFLIYAVSIALLAFIVTNELPKKYKIFLLSGHYLISLGLAAIVYKIGYGFDPFVHEATMELIAKQGVVLPKTPYYLGQYGLIIILHQLSRLSISIINTWLVPLASAILLPYAILSNLQGTEKESSLPAHFWLVILFLPIITFSPFIATTPQNFSYLFLILAILLGTHKKNLPLVAILSAATTAIHPLTGLPAIIWCALLYWEQYHHNLSRRLSNTSLGSIITLAIISLPLALLSGGGARLMTSLDRYWSELTSSLSSLTLAGQEDWALNFTYFFASNFPWLITVITMVAIIFYFRRYSGSRAGLVMISALTASYLISRGLKFESLIDYEQADYAGRIPIIILIFSLPFILGAGKEVIKNIIKKQRTEKLIWLYFGVGLAVISLYISYPRFDNYHNSRGYSTSAFDIEAVNSISQDANTPYVVLSNQQVSAAALKEIGFNNYHSSPVGPLYTYAVPTGGPLYQYYLDMVYESPTQITMKKAADLAGVKLSYLVVNKYWYQSGRIINAAKLSANKWWSIEDEVFVFRYSF